VLFPTATFALFFALVFPLNWLLAPPSRAWKVFILVVSYAFYAYWDWRFVFLIVASTLGNALFGRLIARAGPRAAKGLLALAVVFNLGLLGFFKYYGFFITSMDGVLGSFGLQSGLPYLNIILPVGISFFTFQFLSYVIDIHRRVIAPAPLLDLAIYPAFFPHLVAGPIVRAAEFLPQIQSPRVLLRADLSRAGILIAGGVFKKVVISTYLASAIVDPVFATPGRYSALEILLAIYGYAVQIYADFSGYTDIAIGVALLLGIKFPQNFDRPYSADAIREFWRRWHMTLSRWLRDYLYIPLGGNRYGERRTYVNLMLTMGLGGLWHGASLNFLFWGLYQGAGLSVERWLFQRKARRASERAANGDADVSPATLPNRAWLGKLVTFHFVCLGWVFFRAESVGDALRMLWGLVAQIGPAPLVTLPVLAVIFGSLAWQQTPARWSQRFEQGFARLPILAQGAALGVFFALTVTLGPKGVLPFIYFQF
jgi:alginate O-acetyltransferase complex protein AlgI